MKVIALNDIEYTELERLIGKMAEDREEQLDMMKENLRQKCEIERLERDIEFWKSLYKADKTNWVKRQIKAIRLCRKLGLSDWLIMDIFGIDRTGTLEGYIREMETEYK